jgi:hypothetical protein
MATRKTKEYRERLLRIAETIVWLRDNPEVMMAFSSFNIRTDIEVQAEQLTEARSIITPRGSEQGQEGDWEVTFPDGNVQRMTNEEWEKAQGKDDTEKQTELSGEGISSPGNVEGETKESAEEDSGAIGEKESEETTETPEKSSQTSHKTHDDDRF